MSTLTSLLIVVVTLGSMAACIWLIVWTMKERPDEVPQGEEIDHVWDGDLRELNQPMPRWWLYLFYLTIIFGLVYLILYPGLFQGTKGWTQLTQYEAEMEAAEAKIGPIFAKFRDLPIDQMAADPQALRLGRGLFANHCSTCHGSAGHGATGFPNLTDDDWLYGGTPEQIHASILNGRSGVMPPMAAALPGEELDAMVAYVQALSAGGAGAGHEVAAAKYAALCGVCHGADGRGMQALGAPNLTDDIWLYGGSRDAIRTTLVDGRNGQMPAHEPIVGADRARLIAAYVYSLSKSDPDGGG